MPNRTHYARHPHQEACRFFWFQIAQITSNPRPPFSEASSEFCNFFAILKVFGFFRNFECFLQKKIDIVRFGVIIDEHCQEKKRFQKTKNKRYYQFCAAKGNISPEKRGAYYESNNFYNRQQHLSA